MMPKGILGITRRMLGGRLLYLGVTEIVPGAISSQKVTAALPLVGRPDQSGQSSLSSDLLQDPNDNPCNDNQPIENE
jgi:hypothetical protein